MRHPNYILVVAEFAVLPLAFGALAVAAIFSALNLMLIARRIRHRGFPRAGAAPRTVIGHLSPLSPTPPGPRRGSGLSP